MLIILIRFNIETVIHPLRSQFFFFNDTATTEIYTLSYTTLFRSVNYDLEYGTDALEIHMDAIEPGQRVVIVDDDYRSEEHTSELQSPDHLVCRLLLEKKRRRFVKGQSITC